MNYFIATFIVYARSNAPIIVSYTRLNRPYLETATITTIIIILTATTYIRLYFITANFYSDIYNALNMLFEGIMCRNKHLSIVQFITK
jgi:hypothetical protein